VVSLSAAGVGDDEIWDIMQPFHDHIVEHYDRNDSAGGLQWLFGQHGGQQTHQQVALQEAVEPLKVDRNALLYALIDFMRHDRLTAEDRNALRISMNLTSGNKDNWVIRFIFEIQRRFPQVDLPSAESLFDLLDRQMRLVAARRASCDLNDEMARNITGLPRVSYALDDASRRRHRRTLEDAVWDLTLLIGEMRTLRYIS
jgi:hypothetical protein